MSSETMNLDQLAVYLRRDVREVTKLASRGRLPGQKVAGNWRFARAEINQWLEKQLPEFTDRELTALEAAGADSGEPSVSTLLSPDSMAVPLAAATKSSVLRDLVGLAEQTWNVFDGQAILEAIRQREGQCSTALASGVALPHPHRPLPGALGESVIAFGRTLSGIPFGAPDGSLTDLFFLVCCRDDRTHLRVLARLSRLLLRHGFVDELRAADSVQDTLELIRAAEAELTSV